MILRPYQERAIESVRREYRAGRRRVILMLPTGAGKTVCAAAMIQSATQRGKRVLFFAHRRELIRQAQDRLASWGVSSGAIMAGTRTTDAPVQVASVQTLARRTLPPADVLFVDECHHSRADSYERILQAYPDAFVAGLSATPYRLDGRGLGTLFETIVNPVTIRELIEEGVLIEPDVYAPPGPDLTGVRKVAGEYDLLQLAERMDKLTGDIVEHWREHAWPTDSSPGLRTVGFAVDIAHSRSLTARFQAAGVAAEHADGSLSGAERDALMARWQSGETLMVWNCSLYGEGMDLPSLECAVIARPTASMVWHRQSIGRVMRCADGKSSAIVLDHAGNHHRHGPVTDEVEVSLTDRVRRTGETPTKTCPGCYRVCAAALLVCPECGHVFEVERTEVEEAAGTLVRYRVPSLEDRTREYAGLVAHASATRRRLGWARYRYKERFHVWPSAAREKGGIGRAAADVERAYECAGYEPRASEWGERCGVCCRVKREHAGVLA